MVVFILQCIRESNEHMVYLTVHNLICQFYLNKAGKNYEKSGSWKREVQRQIQACVRVQHTELVEVRAEGKGEEVIKPPGPLTILHTREIKPQCEKLTQSTNIKQAERPCHLWTDERFLSVKSTQTLKLSSVKTLQSKFK